MNSGKITGWNSSGTSARAITASAAPTSIVTQDSVLDRSISSSWLCPSPMALPIITAVAAPRPKHTTRNRRFRLPMTALAARNSTEMVMCPRMTVSRLLPSPQNSSLAITGEAYFTNRRSISQPGRKSAFRSRGMTRLRRAQNRHTANSATRESSVAMAAPSTPSMGKPHLPKISR